MILFSLSLQVDYLHNILLRNSLYFFLTFFLFFFVEIFRAVLRPQMKPLAHVPQTRCSEKFQNIHRKTPVLESLFNKACNFIKYRLQRRCFFCEYCKIFTKNIFYRTHLGHSQISMIQLFARIINSVFGKSFIDV